MPNCFKTRIIINDTYQNCRALMYCLTGAQSPLPCEKGRSVAVVDHVNRPKKDSPARFVYHFESSALPWDLLKAVSAQFPELTFEVMSYDSDEFDYDNFYKGVFKNGVYTSAFTDSQKRYSLFINEFGETALDERN